MTCVAELAWQQLNEVDMIPAINPLRLAHASGVQLVYVDGPAITPLTPLGTVLVDLALPLRERGAQIMRGVARTLLRRYGYVEVPALVERLARELVLPLPWLSDEYERFEGDLEQIEQRHPYAPEAWIAAMGVDLMARGSLRPLKAVRDSFQRSRGFVAAAGSATRH